ncbi:MAG: hypothetical protein OEZ06_04205 [Myxococcales bacterium]|nr:hypothetical protein [Myxococcales bacterium]
MRATDLLIGATVAALGAGCAYQRHTTSLSPANNARIQSSDRPSDLYSFRLIEATGAAVNPSGLPWDDDDTPPDPFVRLYIGDQLVWESEVAEDQSHPTWNATVPKNLVVGSGKSFRLELWDHDSAMGHDPMGSIERNGLPSSMLPGAIARLQLDSKSTVTVLLDDPVPHRGVGLTVEIHSEALHVLGVEPYSPAARAGIKVGERIVGIGPDRVAHLDDKDCASRLSLAADRRHALAVTDAKGGNERQVELDRGYVWLTM